MCDKKFHVVLSPPPCTRYWRCHWLRHTLGVKVRVKGYMAGCSSPFIRPLSLKVRVNMPYRVCSAWPVQCQIYGYLPSRRSLPLSIRWYSFPIQPRIGGWVVHSQSLNTADGDSSQYTNREIGVYSTRPNAVRCETNRCRPTSYVGSGWVKCPRPLLAPAIQSLPTRVKAGFLRL